MIVMVVGPGKCGSSLVAQLLHEELGVSMGQQFCDRKNWRLPTYEPYEDVDFYMLERDFLEGYTTFKFWTRLAYRLIKARSITPAWGWKSAINAPLIPWYLQVIRRLGLEPPVVIRCKRTFEMVVDSCKREWPDYEQEKKTTWEAEVKGREFLLDIALAGVAPSTISFNHHREVKRLKTELKMALAFRSDHAAQIV